MDSEWNIFSKKSFNLVCENNSAKLVKIKPFDISIDIENNNEDLLRSWKELDTFSNKKSYKNLEKFWWRGKDSNLCTQMRADLQSSLMKPYNPYYATN